MPVPAEESPPLPWSGTPRAVGQPSPECRSGEVPAVDVPAAALEGLEWAPLELGSQAGLDRLHRFLDQHYVRGDTYSLRYSPALLRCALLAPGHKPSWHVGLVEPGDPSELVGCITASPHRSTIGGRVLEVAVINFLCVHSDHRKRRLASHLVQEITRRIDQKGKFYAVFTSSTHGMKSATRVPYQFAPLDPEHLKREGFLAAHDNSLAEHLRRAKTPPEVVIYSKAEPRRTAAALHESYQRWVERQAEAVHLDRAHFRHLLESDAITVVFHRETLEFGLFFELDSTNTRTQHPLRALYLLLWVQHPGGTSEYRFFLHLLNTLRRHRPGAHILNTLGHQHSLLRPSPSTLSFCLYNMRAEGTPSPFFMLPF